MLRNYDPKKLHFLFFPDYADPHCILNSTQSDNPGMSLKSVLTCQVAAGNLRHIGKVQRYKYRDGREKSTNSSETCICFSLTNIFWFQKQYVAHNHPCQYRFIKCRENIFRTMKIFLFCQSMWN